MKRVKNFRPTYDYTDEEPISGNYYPVTSRIYISNEDDDSRFAVLNDRAQGGSSLDSGEIELMIHRSTAMLQNNEILDEGLARGRHWATFGGVSDEDGKTRAVLERDLALRKLLEPWMFLSEISGGENLRDSIRLEVVTKPKF